MLHVFLTSCWSHENLLKRYLPPPTSQHYLCANFILQWSEILFMECIMKCTSIFKTHDFFFQHSLLISSTHWKGNFCVSPFVLTGATEVGSLFFSSWKNKHVLQQFSVIFDPSEWKFGVLVLLWIMRVMSELEIYSRSHMAAPTCFNHISIAGISHQLFRILPWLGIVPGYSQLGNLLLTPLLGTTRVVLCIC